MPLDGARSLSPCFFLFWVSGDSRQFPGARSSLHPVAGLEDAFDEFFFFFASARI